MFGKTVDIPVGTEPRGCALTGTRLYVTNFTEGTVSVIDTNHKKVVDKVKVGATRTGSRSSATTCSSRSFSRGCYQQIGVAGEGLDEGKEGVVQHFLRNNFHLDVITLAPLDDSGFTANRVNLCQQFNPMAPNNTFCPDPNATDPTDPVIAQAVAGVFPNQLKSALACDGLLYLPNVGAQPEPPVAGGVNRDTNVQALVHVVDTASKTEREDLRVNLNPQITNEPAPGPDRDSGQTVRQRHRCHGCQR